MFTHLIYMISNKSLEILCKRACLFVKLSLWRDKIKPSLKYSNFKCLSHSLLFDSSLCCSFSFPPFYLSYLYFFRQYINFHRYLIVVRPAANLYQLSWHCFLLPLLLFLYSILLLILFLCPHTINKKC